MLSGCSLCFLFLSESLIFTRNPGVYTLMSLCYLPHGDLLLSNPLQSSPILFNPLGWVHILEYFPVRPSGRGGAKIEVGLDSNG